MRTESLRDESSTAVSRSRGPLFTAALISAAAVYFACFGPLARLTQDGWVSEGVFQIVYAPLIWVISNSPVWVSGPLLHYLVLCGVRLG